MKINKKQLMFLSTLSVLTAFSAVSHSALAATKDNTWYVGVSGSLLMPSQDKTTMLAASRDEQDRHDFVAMPDKVKSNYAVNLSAGMLFNWERNLFPGMRAGFMYSHQGAQQRSGVIFDAVQPALFTNTYKYQLQSDVVLFDQAFELVRWKNFTPYLHTGIGIAQNSVTQYQEVDGDYITNYQFANKSTTGFAYVLGLGIDYKLNRHWNLSVAYDYLNQGVVRLGQSTNSAITSPKNNLNNQMVTIGVRYEFAQ